MKQTIIDLNWSLFHLFLWFEVASCYLCVTIQFIITGGMIYDSQSSKFDIIMIATITVVGWTFLSSIATFMISRSVYQMYCNWNDLLWLMFYNGCQRVKLFKSRFAFCGVGGVIGKQKESQMLHCKQLSWTH